MPQNIISKREILIFIYKYRRRFFLAFIIPFVLCILLSFMPTPHYRAHSVLIVRLGSEYVYQPEIGNAVNNPAPAIPFSEGQISKSEVAILASDDLHAQVINTIGVDKLYPQFASIDDPKERLTEAVESFDRHFGIFLEKESAVINVSFEHKDRALAMQALNTLLTLYLEKRKQLYLEPRSKHAEEEAEIRRDKAIAAAKLVEDYKRQHKIYVLETQREELLAKRSEAEKQATNIASAALESKIATYTKELDQLDLQEREFNALQSEALIAEDSYRLYSHKLDEAKAYDSLQHSRSDSVRIIQPPTAPSRPSRMQFVIILGGFFISLLSMILAAAMTEFIRSGFLTPERAERNLSLPILTVVPFYK